jgi:hypothetical protein
MAQNNDRWQIGAKILVKWTTRVNFTNVLCADFTRKDPQWTKDIDNLAVFFVI